MEADGSYPDVPGLERPDLLGLERTDGLVEERAYSERDDEGGDDTAASLIELLERLGVRM